MLNFDFYNPTRILFGQGEISQLDKLVPTSARVLILLGGCSAKENGTLDEIKQALANRHIDEFSGLNLIHIMKH